MAALLKRLALVLCAYVVASLVTGYAVHGFGLTIGELPRGARRRPYGFGLEVASFIVIFASVPAGIVIALSERFGWRTPWLYAVAGSLIGLALGTLFSPPRWFPWFGLCFGPVSGLMYWAMAGRTAGLAETWQRNILAIIMLVPAASMVLFFVLRVAKF